jgi:hypothetical protein
VTTAWVVAYVVLAALVLLLAIVVLGTLRRVVPALERAEAAVRAPLPAGLRPGSPVPEFVAFAADGSPLDERDFVGPVVLLFIGAACPPCEALINDVRARAEPLSGRVIAVARDTNANRELLSEAPLEVAFHDGSVSSAFQTAATPHAFAISDGVVVDVAVPQRAVDLDALAQQALKGGDRESDPEMAVA